MPRDGKSRRAAMQSATMTLAEPSDDELKALPSDLDWRAKGAVTQVKDQNFCGSCFVFGSVGALEGRNKIKNGKLVDIGEQQGVDCSWDYFGNAGCDGGLAPGVFQNMIDMGGVATESHYPYLGLDGWCNRNDHSSGVVVTGYVNVTGIPTMYKALSEGPVSIAIDASHPSFRFYAKGSPTTTTTTRILAINTNVYVVM
jgi:cathepsin L